MSGYRGFLLNLRDPNGFLLRVAENPGPFFGWHERNSRRLFSTFIFSNRTKKDVENDWDMARRRDGEIPAVKRRAEPSSPCGAWSLDIFKTSSGSINRFFLRKLRET